MDWFTYQCHSRLSLKIYYFFFLPFDVFFLTSFFLWQFFCLVSLLEPVDNFILSIMAVVMIVAGVAL